MDEEIIKEPTTEVRHDYFYLLRMHHHLTYDTCPDNVKSTSPKLFLENPYPISEPDLPFINYFDELLRKKQNFLVEIETCKKDFKGDGRKVPKRVKKDVTYELFPQYLVDICSGKLKDPDAYFPDNCSYNWYYTGGALDYLKFGSSDYVLTPNRQQSIRFTKPNGSSFIGSLGTKFNDENPVYSIKSSLVANDSLLLTLRQKHHVSVILSTLNENGCCSCLQYKDYSDVPYCDINLSNNLDLLFTLKVNGCVESIDVTSGQKIDQFCHYNDDYNMYSYGQIVCVNNNVIFNNCSELIITDNRLSSKVTTRLKDSYCNNICSFIHKDDHFIFAGTKHHLIKYDLRVLAPVAFYAHMLESEPYLISSVQLQNADMICLANQQSKVLIECDDTKGSLPLLLPTVKDTYDKMQMKEKVHIYRNLEERWSSPTIGMKLIKETEDTITLFSLTTAGDIYKQKLSYSQLNKRPESKLSKWIDRLPKTRTDLVLTEVVDMSDARFALNNELDEKVLAKFTDTRKNNLESKGSLYAVDNYLGSHLEEIWLEHEVLDDENTVQMDTSEKVAAWLSAL